MKMLVTASAQNQLSLVHVITDGIRLNVHANANKTLFVNGQSSGTTMLATAFVKSRFVRSTRFGIPLTANASALPNAADSISSGIKIRADANARKCGFVNSRKFGIRKRATVNVLDLLQPSHVKEIKFTTTRFAVASVLTSKFVQLISILIRSGATVNASKLFSAKPINSLIKRHVNANVLTMQFMPKNANLLVNFGIERLANASFVIHLESESAKLKATTSMILHANVIPAKIEMKTISFAKRKVELGMTLNVDAFATRMKLKNV